jgi:Cu-Zn family superoxide dismutase
VAQAVLIGPDGAPHGTVTFREHDGTVEVDIDVENVFPGTHGIHLHEAGDCSADDFASAGDHFAPADSRHGDPDAAEHHAGDFGNVEVGDARSGTKILRSDALTVSDGPRSVVGRAVILHDQADDLSSQPSGAAGARIACGEVRLIASEEHALRGDPAVHY